MTPEHLLLTGATGFLGRRLAADLGGECRVFRASRTAAGTDALALDLAAEDSIRRTFDEAAPKVVIHAGAIAAPDDCERDPELARRVNRDAARVIAELSARAGARLIHLSTDLVFDGEKGWYREDDAPNPTSLYGRTKLEAEEAVLSRAPGAAVIRVSSAYGRPLGGRPTWVDELRAAFARGEAMPAFVDQWRTSTAADQLPEVARRLRADPSLDGVFHWGGAERTTRYELAVALCRAFGFDESLVRPARMSDRPRAASRPLDTSLDSGRLAAALGMAPWTLAEGFSAMKAAAPFVT